jgi:predicted small lipoprotein YifL
MRKSRFRAVLAAAVLTLLSACAQSGPPQPPDPAAFPAPEIVAGAYAEHVAEKSLAAPPAEVFGWLGVGGMIDALQSVPPVSKPIEVTPLSGTWPERGAVRRVRLEDGNFALERVVVYEPPNRMQYQVWAFTTPAASQVSYALGEFRADPAPDGGTAFTWTYRMRAKSMIAQPFVGGFVRDRFAPFMNNGVARFGPPAQ